MRTIPAQSKKTGTKFRFLSGAKDSDYLLSLPHAGMYIPANRGAGTGPCRGVGQSPALLIKSFNSYFDFFVCAVLGVCVHVTGSLGNGFDDAF